MKLAPLQALLEEGVAAGAFPSVRACIRVGGHVAFSGGAGGVDADAVYDLASLTKPLCTAALFLSLWSDGLVSPQTLLARFFPETPAGDAGVTLEDLLAHRSGLPAWRPLFVPVLERWPELLEATCTPERRELARGRLVRLAAEEALEQQPGEAAVYSDVGFILLGEALAQAGGAPLNVLFEARVATPLELAVRFRTPVGTGPVDDIQPTGMVRPRPPAPGQMHAWGHLPTVASLPGEVDDDNAWAMNGVAGHAGLFGTADDVSRFGEQVLDELDGAGRIAPATLWERALRVDASVLGSTRTLGFDTPSAEGSSAGRLIGKRPPGAFGHLGFTGVSLWVDRARHMSVALCTNRTLHGRADARIQAFRARFHDLAAETLAR